MEINTLCIAKKKENLELHISKKILEYIIDVTEQKKRVVTIWSFTREVCVAKQVTK